MSRPSLWSRLFRKPRPASPAKPRRFRPAPECPETRLAPATITVTTTADDAQSGDTTVSLREAITAINAGFTANAEILAQLAANGTAFRTNDNIRFAIPGTGVQSIQV